MFFGFFYIPPTVKDMVRVNKASEEPHRESSCNMVKLLIAFRMVWELRGVAEKLKALGDLWWNSWWCICLVSSLQWFASVKNWSVCCNAYDQVAASCTLSKILLKRQLGCWHTNCTFTPITWETPNCFFCVSEGDVYGRVFCKDGRHFHWDRRCSSIGFAG